MKTDANFRYIDDFPIPNYMIGDWVRHKLGAFNALVSFKIDEIIDEETRGYEVRDRYGLSHLVHDIYPIPLTKEILEKNGGENNHIQPNDDWDIEYRYSAEGGMFIRVTEVGDELTPSRNVFAKELDYVHQFQHLLRLCELNEIADNFKIN